MIVGDSIAPPFVCLFSSEFVIRPRPSDPAMDIAAPRSFSNIGRTADAANKRSTKVHVHKKMSLQPWDGLDLVEQILAEANIHGSRNAREQLHLSSPRVNPVLEDKAVYEGSTTAMSSFLKSTAKLIPNLPAAMTAAEKSNNEEADEGHDSMSTSFKGKGRLPSRAGVKPSPSFLSGARPDPATGSEAPAVGKYLPKYKVVERRAPTPVIGKMTRKKNRPHHGVHDNHHHTETTKMLTATAASEALFQSTALLESGDHSPHRGHTPNSQLDTSVVSVYRNHNIRDVSSAFKSNTPRGELIKSVDLSYWPLPTSGPTTYSGGAFHGNARERSFTPFGTPQGAKVDYNVKEISRPNSSIDFNGMVNRDEHKTRLTYPSEDTTNMDYHPDDTKRSDRHRFHAHYSMSQQILHPKTRAATPGDGMGPYSGSMLTSFKRGFVDIRRMVGRATAFAMDDSESPQELLHPDYSQLERSGPSVAVARTGRDSPGPGRNAPTIHDLSYNAQDSSTRRHRPTCVIPRGQRSTFVQKPTCQRQEPYEPHDQFNVSSIDFSKQLARDVRDKRFEFK
jgi:hypothetical protein